MSQPVSDPALSGQKPDGADAIRLLEEDHRRVERLFYDFEQAEDPDDKADIALSICEALRVHTQVEEELFYPRIREAGIEADMVDEAQVEHDSAKRLIEEIEAMEPEDALFDAKVKVLKEQISHHVHEEETELFPEVRETDVDLASMGAAIAARMAELEGDLDADADDDNDIELADDVDPDDLAAAHDGMSPLAEATADADDEDADEDDDDDEDELEADLDNKRD